MKRKYQDTMRTPHMHNWKTGVKEEIKWRRNIWKENDCDFYRTNERYKFTNISSWINKKIYTLPWWHEIHNTNY